MTQGKPDYKTQIAAESKKWGGHLAVEATGEWHAWTDHPLIRDHYRQRGLIDGLPWEKWVTAYLGHPAERSLDLGCGAGDRSIIVYKSGSTLSVEGVDVSEERIAEAERKRESLGIPGKFRVEDGNSCTFPKNHYELVFSAHSFHHFLELEHAMEQVHEALTPNGLFILDEFVGPTQFQWTDLQIDYTKALCAGLPEDLRMLRWGAVKPYEARPTRAEVVAASPFESIRSADIVPLFRKYFDVLLTRNLGGTIQHLLYNGIVHNFKPDRAGSSEYIEAIYTVEDALIDTGMLPSDFMLLVGRKRRR